MGKGNAVIKTQLNRLKDGRGAGLFDPIDAEQFAEPYQVLDEKRFFSDS